MGRAGETHIETPWSGQAGLFSMKKGLPPTRCHEHPLGKTPWQILPASQPLSKPCQNPCQTCPQLHWGRAPLKYTWPWIKNQESRLGPSSFRRVLTVEENLQPVQPALFLLARVSRGSVSRFGSVFRPSMGAVPTLGHPNSQQRSGLAFG